MEGIQGGKSAAIGNHRYVHIAFRGQKVLSLVYAVKRYKLSEMRTGKLVKSMRKILFVVSKPFGYIGKRDILCVMLGYVKNDLLL